MSVVMADCVGQRLRTGRTARAIIVVKCSSLKHICEASNQKSSVKQATRHCKSATDSPKMDGPCAQLLVESIGEQVTED